MNVGESVDLMTGEMGGCGHEISVLRIARQSIGHGGGVDVAADKGMIDDFAAVQQLALYIDPDLPLPQAVFILLSSFHNLSLSFLLISNMVLDTTVPPQPWAEEPECGSPAQKGREGWYGRVVDYRLLMLT